MPLLDRRTKLKARRAIRNQKRIAESVAVQADEDIERLIFSRLSNFRAVRNFVFIWVLLLGFLCFGVLWQRSTIDSYYITTAPTTGGIYREGVLGNFTTSNPLFAVGSVDVSVSSLLYNGLFKISPKGKIVGDLASSYEIDEKNLEYTVYLKENIKWHDGENFDAEDVLFTYKTIQNSDARSPLRQSWRGVQVEQVDQYTIKFTLPNTLSSFIYSLTNGIVPHHVLANEALENLRTNKFNTVAPIGTGPFTFKTLEVIGEFNDKQERIALVANENYFDKVPWIDGVVIQSFGSEDDMIEAFKDKTIKSMIGLSSVPEDILNDEEVSVQQSALTSAVMVFLNNNREPLNSKEIRQALVLGTDRVGILDSLSYEAVAVNGPFLTSQFPYDNEVKQSGYDLEKAKTILEEQGWVVGEDGIRTKDGERFVINLTSQSRSEYATIVQMLQEDWAELGIAVEATLQPEEDIQKGPLSNHEYDALLYGISIGYDPDVYAYWHSSQRSPNSSYLNLSEYKNSDADDSLEAGRTRVDPNLRKIKYEPFLEAWVEDNPAIALYQPRFLMVVNGTFVGFEPGQLSSATDRYYSIGFWKIKNAEVVK